jgi:type VI secretion system secreted protein Hcp
MQLGFFRFAITAVSFFLFCFPNLASAKAEGDGKVHFAILLKIGDLKGASKIKEHSDWIEVSSLQWGVGRGIGSSARRHGADRDKKKDATESKREVSDPSISEITISKRADSSTVPLFKEAFSKKPLSVKVHIYDLDQQKVVYEFGLSETYISGYSFSGSGDVLNESISFNFTRMDVKQMSPESKFGYDLTKTELMD